MHCQGFVSIHMDLPMLKEESHPPESKRKRCPGRDCQAIQDQTRLEQWRTPIQLPLGDALRIYISPALFKYISALLSDINPDHSPYYREVWRLYVSGIVRQLGKSLQRHRISREIPNLPSHSAHDRKPGLISPRTSRGRFTANMTSAHRE